MSNTTVLYMALAAIAVIVLVTCWKRIVRVVALLAGLGVAAMVAWAFAQQATTARQATTAATVAATGSTAGNVAAVLLAVTLLVVILAGGGYIWLLRRRVSRPWVETQNGMPRVGEDPLRMINALVSLEVLRMMRDMRGEQQPRWALSMDDADDLDNADGIMPAWW